MKAWKVILAAAVIFCSGVVTGFQVASLRTEPLPPQSRGPQFSSGPRQRGDYVDRLQRELELTPPQRTKIEQIWRESGERTKKIWDTAHEEHRKLRTSIRAELTPDQQKKFDEGNRSRDARKPPGPSSRDPRRSRESLEKGTAPGEGTETAPAAGSPKP
ncbi:MAG: hypothetical protein FJ398_17255 [Verrucomicrobia bacterium]|nr:hypothetical protein [Verrucomicrobiota bacterium]